VAVEDTHSTTTFDPTVYAEWNLPTWVPGALHDAGFAARYELFLDLNPYFQVGRFDEDDAVDVALQIRERASGKRGVAFVHSRDRSVHIVAAGQQLAPGLDDFSAIWVWRVQARAEIDVSRGGGRDLLLVSKPEASTIRLWWDGHHYAFDPGTD